MARKTKQNVASFARAHTETAVKTLAGIMTNKESPEAARVSAAKELLDRGWGKAAQPLTGEEGEGPIIFKTVYEKKPEK